MRLQGRRKQRFPNPGGGNPSPHSGIGDRFILVVQLDLCPGAHSVPPEPFQLGFKVLDLATFSLQRQMGASQNSISLLRMLLIDIRPLCPGHAMRPDGRLAPDG